MMLFYQTVVQTQYCTVPNSVVFGDVNPLRKFEGYYPSDKIFAGTLEFGKLGKRIFLLRSRAVAATYYLNDIITF